MVTLLLSFVRFLIGLRYKVNVKGLTSIGKEEKRGILFLPNHQALVDPVIMMSILYDKFHPRPLADATQVSRAGNSWLLRHIRPITLPDPQKDGRGGKERIQEALREVATALRNGENVLLYPSGRLCRSAKEDLAGNSGVEYLLEQVPGVKTVLVRISGLWGSRFSWSSGMEPMLFTDVKKTIAFFFANLIFFGPRRQVTVEMAEDTSLPALQGRQQINEYLERNYNGRPEHNTYVPYYWWQGGRAVRKPEPEKKTISGDVASVSTVTKNLVLAKITELAGQEAKGESRLANDLAMDSLTLMELVAWLESEFGATVDDLSALNTVNDCIMAAAGQILHAAPVAAKKVPDNWFADSERRLLLPESGTTIADFFLAHARQFPDKVLLADQVAGAKTFRDIVTAMFVLKPIFQRIEGENVGIMLPATVSATIVYLAVILSGKTPVMINWTTGIANVQHGLDLTEVSTVITARALYRKLTGQGVELSAIKTKWLFLDEVAPTIPLAKKIKAALQARFSLESLGKTKLSGTAVILFTSGSEARPKAVPLSHANIIAVLRDFSSVVTFSDNNRLLGMLPPFHSLGLVGTVVFPLCSGLRTVYHANPTESTILAGLIARYKASIVIGTPTFLQGILKAGTKEQLQSLRLVLTGAEKCPEHTARFLHEVNPAATLCEGYGITECAPLVSINRVEAPKLGTIGKIMPSMEYVIIDPDSERPVAIGKQGILLVRGPNIFAGYYKDTAGTGFSMYDGKQWYNTGDFVKEDEEGVITFCGRKKRFVKLGGEMISLPAIENALFTYYPADTGNGPTLAVESTPDEERPEIVLFTTLPLVRDEVNTKIKEAGLSPLHNIRIMKDIEKIPVLGTGKTDYKLLKQMLSV